MSAIIITIITINVNVISLCDIRCESEYRFLIIFSIYIQPSIQNVKQNSECIQKNINF